MKKCRWYMLCCAGFLDEFLKVLPGDLVVQGLNLKSLSEGLDVNSSCFRIHV